MWIVGGDNANDNWRVEEAGKYGCPVEWVRR